ncbi:MAG: Rpn family recombination-promoting nuclease/putative transposase [Clostridia bacterium]|nr:Rpn family recombination-promoting nuclease/putative transposase [Clostridia bacterium]
MCIKNNKLLKPTNDYVFKRIFGKKGNEDITIGFLETITGIRYDKISLEDTPILERDLFESKMGVLDIKVIVNKIIDIDIEMQVVKNENEAERILWYWAKMYSTSIKRGEGYENTNKVICILIADFCLENLNSIPKYHTKWQIREEDFGNVILTEKLEIHIIELTKLENINETDKKLAHWCKFIKTPEKVEDSIMNENDDIKKAKEELDKMSQDENERRLAEIRERAILFENTLRNNGYNKGRKEGEKAKQLEIAKNMLNENFNIEQISKITGLSVEEIQKLK